MCYAIEDDEAEAYYRKVADELERIAEAVRLQPDLDHDLSVRLREFAHQIRLDTRLSGMPLGVTLN
ncbi:MAG TPA: hypothetical protein VGT78_13810 [Rhizomicrobium sp.]|nr:hypothetical protein [Rhizomicrobium sp.]